MDKNKIRLAVCFIFLLLSFSVNAAFVKGIYLTQNTLEDTSRLNGLIKKAKAVGIDTFVVDLQRPSKRYRDNLGLLEANNIKYVARIVMFPDGGTPAQIKNPDIWQKNYSLVKQAVDWGADEIQLDYIRYNTKQRPSSQNAKDILVIIDWYKKKLASQNIPLQIDVFGVTSLGESKYIGQNVPLFAPSIDAICPMVYPSHYEPFSKHYKIPFETVYHSLTLLQKQFGGKMPIKMYAYIELSNYHYPMSVQQKRKYIEEQIDAVNEAGADGWYAWSPNNKYENLFAVLEENKEG